MSDAQKPEPVLFLETTGEMENFFHTVAASSPTRSLRIAIDTEADSLHSYREKLCLIQFRCNGHAALIDPLAISDLSPFMDFIEDQEVWLHGADYDLSLFKRNFGRLPMHVFDTQIAARLLGAKRFGLAALLEEHFGHHMPKGSQKADWSRRPLTDDMERYALDDVFYLLPLADLLLEKLREKGRLDWFHQSCAAQVKQVLDRPGRGRERGQAVIDLEIEEGSEPWRVTGSGKMSPLELAFLRAAWNWRDSEAAMKDRPAFKVLSNDYLLSIAQTAAEKAPWHLPGRPRPDVERRLQLALTEVEVIPPPDYPRRPRGGPRWRTQEGEAKVDALRAHRDRVAAEVGIEGSMIATRTALDTVIYHPQEIGEALLPWQWELLKGGIEAPVEAMA